MADPEPFDVDPDPDPTFQAYADPDLDPNPITRVKKFFIRSSTIVSKVFQNLSCVIFFSKNAGGRVRGKG